MLHLPNAHGWGGVLGPRQISLSLSFVLVCIVSVFVGLVAVARPVEGLLGLSLVILFVFVRVIAPVNKLVGLASFAVVLTVYSIVLTYTEGDTSFLAAGLLPALVAVTFLVKRNDRRLDLFSPFVLTCIGFLLAFGWVGLELIRDSEIPRHIVSYTLWYVNLGFILFLAGYGTKLGGMLGRKVWLPGDDWSASRIRSAFLGCTILGLFLFLLIVWLTGYSSPLGPLQNVYQFRVATQGGLSYIVYLIFFFFQTASVLLLVGVLRTPHRRAVHFVQVPLFVLCVCAVFWLFASRFMFVNLVGGLLICIHYLKRQLRLVEVVVVGFLLMLFVAAYGLYRDVGYRWQTTVQVQEAFARLKIRGSVVGRLDALARLTTILQHPPRYDPATVVQGILMRPIPRNWAPEKPYASGAEITRVLWPEVADYGVTLEPSIFGELYFDFGIFGIIFGMIVFGVLVRALQTYFEGKTRRADFLLHYSLIFLVPIRLLLGGFDSGGTVDLIVFTLGAWAVFWYLRWGMPRRHAAKSTPLAVPSPMAKG